MTDKLPNKTPLLALAISILSILACDEGSTRSLRLQQEDIVTVEATIAKPTDLSTIILKVTSYQE